jgi:hypothetical protein
LLPMKPAPPVPRIFCMAARSAKKQIFYRSAT